MFQQYSSENHNSCSSCSRSSSSGKCLELALLQEAVLPVPPPWPAYKFYFLFFSPFPGIYSAAQWTCHLKTAGGKQVCFQLHHFPWPGSLNDQEGDSGAFQECSTKFLLSVCEWDGWEKIMSGLGSEIFTCLCGDGFLLSLGAGKGPARLVMWNQLSNSFGLCFSRLQKGQIFILHKHIFFNFWCSSHILDHRGQN